MTRVDIQAWENVSDLVFRPHADIRSELAHWLFATIHKRRKIK
ncbi:MAG: hypothetical protein U0905_17790 [Pirellulales bacterium]